MNNTNKSYNELRIPVRNQIRETGKIYFRQKNKITDSPTFELNEKITVYISIPRSLLSRTITLTIYNESLNETKYDLFANLTDVIGNSEIYSLKINFKGEFVGVYFLEIKITSYNGHYYCYNKNGALVITRERIQPNIQLLISDFKYKKPDVYGGIIYHIFVDRFARQENEKESEPSLCNWNDEISEFQKFQGEQIKNDYFYGGTLNGISDKLEYLKSLGVTLIYLSPIFESKSNHKYDTGDYLKVDSGFGGDTALENLIINAKKHGIGIILDGVFNHTGSDSRYFNINGNYSEIGAFQSKESRYYTWYNFYSYPDNYECWWGVKILPRINTECKSCFDFFVGENGVIDKYAKLGIKGFRLDVADELSDHFIRAIKKRLVKTNENNVLYGEVWEDASNKVSYNKRREYYLGSELDGVMNYPLREGLIYYLREKNQDKLRYSLTDIIKNAPKRIRDAQMNILGSHDTERILTALGGLKSDGYSNEILSKTKMTEAEYNISIKRLKAAYTIISTLPGIPSIYYGDEVGCEGYNDPFNRRTFPWGNENFELLNHYKKIGMLRNKYKVYREGDFKLLYLSIDILLFVRYNNRGPVYITLLNNSKDNLKISFSSPAKSLTDDVYFNFLNLSSEEAKILELERDSIICLSF